jgi:hypothetical protein
MNETGSAIGRLFGWILITAGGLWMLLAGGCTLTFLVGGLLQAMRTPQLAGTLGMIPLFLGIGLIGAAPGIVLFALGLVVLRRAKGPPPMP